MDRLNLWQEALIWVLVLLMGMAAGVGLGIKIQRDRNIAEGVAKWDLNRSGEIEYRYLPERVEKRIVICTPVELCELSP